MSRETCYRCFWPKALCWCSSIQSMDTRTRIVLLMHPKEFKQEKAGTGRLTHLCLARSEIHMGIGFDHDEAVQALIHDPRNYPVLLYPGTTARNLSRGDLTASDLGGRQLVVFVLDATWSGARKMLRLSPTLQALPRIMFTPAAPSRFVIKQQPQEGCLSTLEAVHERLTREINHWSKRANDLAAEVKAGKQPKLQPDNARKRVEDLKARLDSRRRELEAQLQLSSNPPTIAGWAVSRPRASEVVAGPRAKLIALPSLALVITKRRSRCAAGPTPTLRSITRATSRPSPARSIAGPSSDQPRTLAANWATSECPCTTIGRRRPENALGNAGWMMKSSRAGLPQSGSTTRRSASLIAPGSNWSETSSSISSITGTPARGPQSSE